jgi:glycosyltransferase involved in cell wall biosynthesis
MYQMAVGSADAIMVQTERQCSLLMKHFGVGALLIPNGYDLPARSEIYAPRDRSHILWVGSSDPEKKNPEMFVELARRLPDLNFTMISQPIAGKEEFHSELRQKATSVTNVDFLGPVAPNEIHDYYQTAILLVNTSDYEGFPNTFLEAWRYETPVVSLYFDLDGLLKKECGGIRAGRMENLVMVVCELTSDISRRAELGASGRKYMKENFSLTRVVDLYEEAFSKALK